jgi:hypothetical protein
MLARKGKVKESNVERTPAPIAAILLRLRPKEFRPGEWADVRTKSEWTSSKRSTLEKRSVPGDNDLLAASSPIPLKIPGEKARR